AVFFYVSLFRYCQPFDQVGFQFIERGDLRRYFQRFYQSVKIAADTDVFPRLADFRSEQSYLNDMDDIETESQRMPVFFCWYQPAFNLRNHRFQIVARQIINGNMSKMRLEIGCT